MEGMEASSTLRPSSKVIAAGRSGAICLGGGGLTEVNR